ncbi:MAG: excinuclease ABC subunit UvrC [bacterium]
MDHVITKQLKHLPSRPGVYLYKDLNAKTLYVGKAKNLSDRVRSYFTNFSSLSPAKQEMIIKAKQLDYIILPNETEALLMENKLIKQHRPQYNIIWKDDKDFLYLKLQTNPKQPVIVTRELSKHCYGPYPNAQAVRLALMVINRVFLKGWTWPIYREKAINEQKNIMEKIKRFLQGDYQAVIKQLEQEMTIASSEQQYELAANLRDQLKSLTSLLPHIKTAKQRGASADYLSCYQGTGQTAIHVFQVRHSQIIQGQQWLLKNTRDAREQEVMARFISQYYPTVSQPPKQIIVPMALPELDAKAILALTAGKSRLTIAHGKGQKELLDTGQANAELYLKREAIKHIPSFNGKQAIQELKKALKRFGVVIASANKLRRIECYDISNIQGEFPVGSMVVATNGQMDKKEYRHFAIKTVEGSNDFAMHAEMMERRLRRSYDKAIPSFERWPKPDLLVIDGGKGQLTAVKRIIEKWDKNIPFIGLAKEEEEIFTPHQGNSLKLPKNSLALYLLQRLRDEAHRFAIQYYRKKHRKDLLLTSHKH